MDANNLSIQYQQYQRAVAPSIDTITQTRTRTPGKQGLGDRARDSLVDRQNQVLVASRRNLSIKHVDHTHIPNRGLKTSHSVNAAAEWTHTPLQLTGVSFSHAPIPVITSSQSLKVLSQGVSTSLIAAGTPLHVQDVQSTGTAELNLQVKGFATNPSMSLSPDIDVGSDVKYDKHDLVLLSNDLTSDGILFANLRHKPDSLVVIRTLEVME